MNWKKICGAFLAMGMLLFHSTFAFAAANVSERELFDLTSLGIIRGTETGDMELDKAVTRAEFSAMVTRLVSADGLPVREGRTEFKDVKPEDWFYSVVYSLYDQGVISGDGQGMFHPDSLLSAQETVKILVTVLGYQQEAEASGGYPNGYQAVGLKAGILDGVSLGEQLIREDVFRMIYNCLDIYVRTPDYLSSDEKETLRDRLMGTRAQHSTYKVTGIMQATPSTWIIPGDYHKLKDNQVIIDGVLYETDVPEAADFIGKQVECYVIDQDDTLTISSIRETSRNSVLEITDEDFVNADLFEIRYRPEERVESVKLSATAVLMKNMRIIGSWTAEDLKLSQGELTLIDNDGDQEYDVIHIKEFETYLISEVKGNVIYFKQRDNGQAKKLIDFQQDQDVDYIITDAEGELLEVSDLTADVAVSIFESEDKTVCRIVTGRKPFSAALEKIEDKYFYFAGEPYEAENGFTDPYQLGDAYKVYLNYRGELFMLSESAEQESVLQYGYVAKIAEDDGVGGQLRGKIVRPGDFVEVEEKSVVEDDDSVTLKLKGQNKDLVTMNFAQQVVVNGKKMDSEALEAYFTEGGGRSNRVIAYRTNAAGEIRTITAPEAQGRELAGRDEKRVYNAKEKVFGGMLVGAFGATEQTKVLMIPDYDKQGEVSDEDYFAVAEINDQQAYTVNGYDVTGERECVKLIAITTTLQYDASSAILDTDKMALLTGKYTELDEDGTEKTRLSFLSDGANRTYVVADNKVEVAEAMKNGDIFYYAISPSSNEINKIVRVDNAASPDRGMGQFGQPGDSNPEGKGQITAGTVTDIDYEKIDDLSNRRKDRLEIELGNGESAEIYINSRNAPAIYRYNSRTNTAEAITCRDILPQDGHIMVHVKNNTVRGVVVVW